MPAGAGELRIVWRARPISSWSKARAARPRSTCAPATSPTWASPPRPMCRWCSPATSTAAASSPAWSAPTRCSSRPSARASAAFVINKFRGDASLFDDGVAAIERRTGWPCLGVVPWLPEAALAAGRGCGRSRAQHARRRAALTVAVPMLARIANFDDLDPLAHGAGGVRLVFVRPGEADSGRCRPRHPAGLEIDHRRSRVPARAGLGHRSRGASCGAAAACSACAAATRCSAAPSPIPMESKGRPARSRGSACSTSTTVMTADKSTGR